MASYTIRVELRDATAEDYENLHERMKHHGFRRSLICKQGNVYWLPHEEYVCVSFDTRQEILDRAFQLATEVNVNPAVLVTESTGRTWRGLEALDCL
ncbi:type V toxin-antitoxin system endoribonuclease antitoxin GhoS [Duffyella gerundensis]|uniref:DUF2622 domain-containing protein n=1 Tax=Duffyella gerundensis TaxID=1619313 RepID=A0A0U5L5W6_9GAMM|nr:type V toxin-antitoxin system endoribonuclease antitoxin GhoS [Duffyella gerundensis]CUU24453.1 hypothetical protein EM595_2219 [Duffyella gerundensis]